MSSRVRLIVLLCLCIIAASFAPTSWHLALRDHLALHYVAHLLAFGFLAFVVVQRNRTVLSIFIVLASIVLLGAVLEFGEHLRNGFPVEWLDIITDGAGAILGCLPTLAASHWRNQKS